MHFCDKCRSQFNITKDVDAKMVGGVIHSGLAVIFDKFANGEQLEISDLDGITINDIYNDNRYESMTKKSKDRIKTWLRSASKSFVQNDIQDGGKATQAAYFICKFCDNHKEIEPKTVIFSQSYRTSASTLTGSEFESYDPTLARTKAYICPNSECATHKGSPKEAALSKDESGHIVFICVTCNAQWSQRV